ncbi:Fungal specific transcription factor domain containing protein [Pyrenophora tritici-repentis]|nr:Fungal specific transcription factor domain containing protein [Pyrenophora tritici-repentis]
MMQSYLNRFGLYQRKKTGRMLVPSKSRNKGPCEEVALWEDDETSLLWSMLGYGFTWTQHRSYGKLLPSLSVFPVVSSYANELDSVLEFDDLRSFQQLISSGTVHPFQRDEHGWSLLHYAAWHNRVDICQLLKAYGVKSDTTYSGTTELYLAIRPIHTLGCEDQIATFRCFLNDDEPFIENFGHDSWVYLAYQVEDDTLEWLVQQIGRLLPLEESINIRQSVTRGRWRQLSSKFEKDPLMKHPKLLLTKNFLRHVKLDQFPILEDLFSGCCNVPDSYIVGAVFIEWLKASDVNVEEYMKLFLKDAEIGTVEDKDRDIVFETYGEGDWRLGFKWVFDPEASGYHLVSEHQALGCCRRSLRLTYPGDEVYKNRIGEYESRIKLLESLLNERNAKQPELHKQPVWHETEPTVPLSSWVDSLRDEVNFGSRPEFPDLNPFDLDPVVGGNDDAITEDIAELSVMETGQNNLTTDSSSQISTEDMQPSEEFQEDAAFLQSAEFEPGIASQTPPPMPVQPPCDGYLPPPEVGTSLLAEFLTDMNTACPLYQPHVIADHLRVCYAGLSDGSVVAWTNAYVVFGIAHNLRAMSTTGTIHDMEMAQYYFARVYTALNRLLTAPSSLGQVQCLIGVELLIMGSPCSYNKSEGHFISTALRIARSLVYHHDTTGPAVVPDDTAQLRRVFWIAFINDSNLSIINNTPRTFRLEDVAESAELIANELGTVTAAEGDWQVHIFFLSTRLALLQTEAIDQVLSLRTRNTDPLELAAAATIVLARLQAFHQQHQVFQRDANELFQLLYQSDVVHCVVLESKYFATVYRLHAFMALDMNAKINPFELEGLSMMSRLKHQSVVREAKRLLSLLSVAPRGNIALYWMIHPILAAALVTVFAHHINNPKNEALTSTEMLVYKQVLINFDVMLQAGVNPDLEQNKGLYLGMFTRVEEEIRMR